MAKRATKAELEREVRILTEERDAAIMQANQLAEQLRVVTLERDEAIVQANQLTEALDHMSARMRQIETTLAEAIERKAAKQPAPAPTPRHQPVKLRPVQWDNGFLRSGDVVYEGEIREVPTGFEVSSGEVTLLLNEEGMGLIPEAAARKLAKA